MGFGPDVKSVEQSDGSTTISITAGATVYTKAYPLRYGAYFAVAYKAASAGAIDLTIQIEQSWTLPATEGASDPNYVIPESMADIATNLADANWHNNSISPVAIPYIRFKITSAAGVTNTLQIKLSIQESL